MTGISRRAFLTGSVSFVAATGTAAWAKPGGTTTNAALEVDRFIEDVMRANVEGQGAVDEVLARAVSEPGRVVAALGEPGSAGLDVLHRASDLTILNVIWAPRMVLLAHDHKMWASIGIYTGREDNIIWKRQGSTIEAKRAASLSEREVFPLGEDAIHSVVNPISRYTGAIHVYGGDFFAPGRSEWDPETLSERPFDFEGLRGAFEGADKRSQPTR